MIAGPPTPTRTLAPMRARDASVATWVVHALAWSPPLLGAALVLPTALTAVGRSVLEPWALLAPFLRWPELVGSVVYAAAIAAVALVVAWPVAWAARHWTPRRLALLAAPLLLPNFLAYAGWTLLRAPGTALGDAIFRLGQAPGFEWVPVAAGRALAVWGLGLWAWPIAAVVLWTGWQRVDRAVLEALRLDAPGRARAAVEHARLMRPAILAAAGLIGALMIGSAVPLHVAQARTHAIGVWLALDQSPPGERWRAWIAGWPLIVAGALAALWIAAALRTTAAAPLPAPHTAPARGRWLMWGAPLAALAISVGAPIALFARALAHSAGFDVIARFASLASAELTHAAVHGGLVAAWAFALILAAARAAHDAPRAMGLALASLLALGLAPGVLVGAAIAEMTAGVRWTEPWAHIPNLAASVLRVGMVPIAVGVWVGLIEPADHRALRLLDAATGVRGWWGWWVARGPVLWGVAALGAVATGVLAVHEIEAAVQVMPPGSASLSRMLLNALHFARDDDLSAAVMLMSGVGLLGGAAIGLCGFASGRAPKRPA